MLLDPLEERILARATAAAVLDPIEIESVASDIRGWIEHAQMPDGIRKALNDAITRLPSKSGSYIARTSMTSEELASAFGSGVKRAFLGAVGEKEIYQAIAQCWATPFSSRALYYRNRKKIKQTSVNLGVLVQPLIRADAAGMMFTANPHNGSSDSLVIESIWGLGEPATGARVKPDRFEIDKKTGTILSNEIASKSVRLDIGPDGHLVQLAIEESIQDSPSMSDASLGHLSVMGRRVETMFGEPQEIEWALSGDDIYILQSRPIGQRK
jgi:pyruvate,water dikinase